MVILLVAVAGFFINAPVAFAQFAPPDLPCDPDDINCPIDSWCIALALIALISTTAYLYHKQKLEKAIA